MLPVSAPFHCALMQPAQEEVARVLAGLTLADPRIPVAANVTGELVTTADAAQDALIRQVTGAVRWVDCMQALMGAGAELFIEVGPGKVLCGLLQADRPGAEGAECGRCREPGGYTGGVGNPASKASGLHPLRFSAKRIGAHVLNSARDLVGLLTRQPLRSQVKFHARRRKVQRVRLGVVVQVQRLALAAIDQDRDQQPVPVPAGQRNLVALDHAVFVVRAGGAPVLLKARKGIGAVLRPGAAASSCRASRCRRPWAGRSFRQP